MEQQYAQTQRKMIFYYNYIKDTLYLAYSLAHRPLSKSLQLRVGRCIGTRHPIPSHSRASYAMLICSRC